MAWLCAPPIPEGATPTMLTTPEPSVAVLLVVSVMRLVDVVGFVPNVAVTPAGSETVLSETDPAKDPIGAMVSVVVTVLPCTRVAGAGDRNISKDGLKITMGRFVDALDAPE